MRTHATSIRRFGMGVPSVSAPPGATPAQIEEAQRIASGMRAGDEAGAGLPDGYEFRLTGLTGAAPDALGFLGYLDQQITGSALANIVELAHSTYGSKALGESFLDLFLLALQAAADLIGDTATFGSPSMPGIARALTEYNFGEGQAIPRIVCTDVGDRHEITSDAMNLLMGAGAITPDPELEEFLRTAWGLPARPKDAPVPQPPAPPGANGQGQNGQGGQQLQGGNVTARTRLPRGAAPFPGTSWRRREMTQVEAAAGMDPDGILADLEDAATRLTAAWAPVLRDQRADLSAQVAQHVDSASLAALADLTVPDAGGADLLASAMTELAWTAARRAAAEASSQRVVIDMTRVTIDEGRLTAVAQARAVLAGQQLAHAATRRALRVVQATAGDDAAGEVEVHLAGLSPTPLGDQLRAALSTAQNSGRAAAFEQADDQGVTYTASEINDANTCDPCGAIDQTEFESIEEATAAYVNGGYVDCEGELRCRGTFIATYPDVTVTAPGDLPGTLPEEAPEPEDSLAAWSTDGVWDEDRAALHDQIVDQILAGAAPADEPVAYFMGGGPAAGKSSMPTPGGGLAALIDPDAIKALLPEYQQMVAAGDSRAAAYVHEESSHIAGLVRGQASARSLSFIVDGTGDSSYQKMAGKVQAARAGGATRVEADYVTIDTAEAIRRATKRAQRTGRMVPEAVITSIHAEVTKVFDQAVREGLFDEARLWDNSGASAVQIAHYTREGGLVVSDEQAWARFLAKAAG